ncbi:MAG: SRPBCC family protein [Bacilli bacterium]|nr:SRPBCC family protein [Bacilli bacterium]
MATSEIKVIIPCEIEKVWNFVTSLENYQWRSDLKQIEVINDSQFIEYTKEGYATNFTVTKKEAYKCWQFDMENDNMKGHWTGLFIQKGNQTEIVFTEEVMAKKVIMKPFIKAYLKKQQAIYIADLKKGLL